MSLGPAPEQRRSTSVLALLVLFAALGWVFPTKASADPPLGHMSLEDLMQIEVVSVSNRAQRLGDAAAAVYVISNEDIRRAGATSVPDALRLAPGVQVAQIDANKWAISVRGFNDQFTNKLLVMIDGRSVYSPLFSGVFWDVQNVVLEDVDRIEVVRGPGGTIWGANAVNGVINIITRSAAETQGALVSVRSGSDEPIAAVGRFGGRVGEDLAYRIHIEGFDRSAFEDESGGDAEDDWNAVRGGFRIDWEPAESDTVTFAGDGYGGRSGERLLLGQAGTEKVDGLNLLGRWQHVFESGSTSKLQLYYDRTQRDDEDIYRERRELFDLALVGRVTGLPLQDLAIGVGYRLSTDHIFGRGALGFDPEDRTDHVVSAFVQDQVGLFDDRLILTLGSKLEVNSYTGFEYQPSVRGLFSISPRQRIWAAVSRAVRTPSRTENGVDVVLPRPTSTPVIELLRVRGDAGFRSEKLLAYEIGYRAQPVDPVTLDVAAFFSDYEDLFSVEQRSSVGPAPCLPPYAPATCQFVDSVIGNGLDAKTWGVEVVLQWQPIERLRLEATYSHVEIDLDSEPGSSGRGLTSEGTTPENQVGLRANAKLPWSLELDGSISWIDGLESAGVGAYTRLDLGLAWRPERLPFELSLVGQNLTRDDHAEFGDGFFTLRSRVPRSVYGKVVWRY